MWFHEKVHIRVPIALLWVSSLVLPLPGQRIVKKKCKEF